MLPAERPDYVPGGPHPSTRQVLDELRALHRSKSPSYWLEHIDRLIAAIDRWTRCIPPRTPASQVNEVRRIRRELWELRQRLAANVQALNEALR